MGERRNLTGTAYALSVFTAILKGHEETVREVIESLPRGQDAPIARLGNVHTSRLQIFKDLVHQGPSQKPDKLRNAYLVFTAAFDGELEPFLDSILRVIPGEADSWWRHCVGYPGVGEPAAFKAWIRHNQVHTSLFAVASPNQSVPGVLDALELRERVSDFVIGAQGLDAAELQKRFRETFREVR
jgi:hypothetical protein